MMVVKINILIIFIFLLFQCKYLVQCHRVKRIIGGSSVECVKKCVTGTQPRVGSLRNSTCNKHLCGVTLLSRDHALTAAHCVENGVNNYFVQLNNYCTEEQNEQPRFQVEKIIIHEEYDRYKRNHDIAILKIRSNLTHDSWLEDDILPKSVFGITGDCAVFGYGVQDLNSELTSNDLKGAEVRIVSLDECYDKLGQYMAPEYDSGMMCGLGVNADSCQGDSGGPMLCNGGAVIQGVVSYGLSCGVDGVPSVFASVAAHKQWIKTNVSL